MARRADWPRSINPDRRIVRYLPDPVGPSYPDPGDPDPPDPPAGGFDPPARTYTVTNAPSGTTVVTDTHYVDPQGALVFPDNIAHVTVTGALTIPTQIKGWDDVHIQGRSDRWIDSGPRSDGGDLLQVKRGPNAGPVPQDITIRFWFGHDVTRPVGKHSDGLQLMCGRRITFVDCDMARVSVQPWFVRDAGGYTASNGGAGGGPIEDILFFHCRAWGQAEGTRTWNVAGDDEVDQAGRFVPTRVLVAGCSGSPGASMDAAAIAAGGEISDWTDL